MFRMREWYVIYLSLSYLQIFIMLLLCLKLFFIIIYIIRQKLKKVKKYFLRWSFYFTSIYRVSQKEVLLFGMIFLEIFLLNLYQIQLILLRKRNFGVSILFNLNNSLERHCIAWKKETKGIVAWIVWWLWNFLITF